MKALSRFLFLLAVFPLTSIAIYSSMYGSPHGLMGLSALVWIIIIVSFFVVFGFISHILIEKYRSRGKKGGKVLYILTYPAYVLPMILIWLLKIIAKLIGYFISVVINNDSSRDVSQSEEKIYVVYEDGYRRELSFLERKTDYTSKEPYYGKYYNRFVDDVGRHWRSYDNNKSFLKETYDGYLYK